MQKGSIIQKHQEPIRFQPSKWTSSLTGGFSYKKTKQTTLVQTSVTSSTLFIVN